MSQITEKIRQIFRNPADPKITVIVRRNMRLKVGDDMVEVKPGDEVEIATSVLRQLEGSDFELSDKNRPAEPEVIDPSPPRAEPRPLPEGWSALPQSFASWWENSEKLRVAIEHVRAVRDAIQIKMGFHCEVLPKDVKTLIVKSFFPADPKNVQNGGVIYTGPGVVDLKDPKLKRLNALMHSTLRKAIEYVDTIAPDIQRQLARLHYECGLHKMELHELVDGLAQESCEIGFEIFSRRIEALGLSQAKNRELFHGSADFAKYHCERMPATGNIFAGYGEDGIPIVANDEPVMVNASRMLSLMQRREELEKQVARGRKELAQTKRAATAAA